MFCGLRKRETDSERQMETHRVRRKRGEKRKETDANRESAAARWSPTEERIGSREAWGNGFVFSLSLLSLHLGLQRVSPGPKPLQIWARRKPGDFPSPNWRLEFVLIFFYFFFLKHFPCFQVFKKQITHGILLNNKKESTMDTQDTLDGSHGHYAE